MLEEQEAKDGTSMQPAAVGVPKRPGCAPFAARAQSDRDWE
jgi:hypothetical protein